MGARLRVGALRALAFAGAGAALALALALEPAQAPPSCLPLLAPGPLLVGASYSPPAAPAAANLTAALFARVVALGGRLVQISLPWADIEPVPLQPNFVLVAEVLAAARAQGLVPLFNLAVIDTEHVSVPPDLADPADVTRLRPGLDWNSSELIDRFATVLEVVAPLAAFSGAPYFGVGNEVSVNLGERPETGYAFAEFLFVMHKFVKQLTSADMAVGVTMTVADLAAFAAKGAGGVPEWAQLLLAISDVVPLTYYAVDNAFHVVTDRATIAGAVLGAASVLPAGACVVFQEFGMPSGYGNASSVDGGSEARQAAFFAELRGALDELGAAGHEVRAASLFQLVDADPDACLQEARYYNASSSPAFVEYLCTLGVVRSDGAPKPGFAAFVAAFLGGGSDRRR
jgi:hypothetical protein